MKSLVLAALLPALLSAQAVPKPPGLCAARLRQFQRCVEDFTDASPPPPPPLADAMPDEDEMIAAAASCFTDAGCENPMPGVAESGLEGLSDFLGDALEGLSGGEAPEAPALPAGPRLPEPANVRAFMELLGGAMSGAPPQIGALFLPPQKKCLMKAFEEHVKPKVETCVRRRIPGFVYPRYRAGKAWDPFGEGPKVMPLPLPKPGRGGPPPPPPPPMIKPAMLKKMMGMLSQILGKVQSMGMPPPPLPRARDAAGNPFEALSKLFSAANKFAMSPESVEANDRIRKLSSLLGARRRSKRMAGPGPKDLGPSPVFLMKDGMGMAKGMNSLAQAVYNVDVCPKASQAKVAVCLKKLSAASGAQMCRAIDPMDAFLNRAQAHSSFCGRREECYQRLIEAPGCTADFWDQKWLLCRCGHQMAFDAPDEVFQGAADSFRECMVEEGGDWDDVADDLAAKMREKLHAKVNKYYCDTVHHPCMRGENGLYEDLELPQMGPPMMPPPPPPPMREMDEMMAALKSISPGDFTIPFIDEMGGSSSMEDSSEPEPEPAS